ncbi:hypothetical protein LEMLEM_LOCUS4969 [Lemmus lemmus]
MAPTPTNPDVAPPQITRDQPGPPSVPVLKPRQPGAPALPSQSLCSPPSAPSPAKYRT